jgi:hypothetical protein
MLKRADPLHPLAYKEVDDRKSAAREGLKDAVSTDLGVLRKRAGIMKFHLGFVLGHGMSG